MRTDPDARDDRDDRTLRRDKAAARDRPRGNKTDLSAEDAGDLAMSAAIAVSAIAV